MSLLSRFNPKARAAVLIGVLALGSAEFMREGKDIKWGAEKAGSAIGWVFRKAVNTVWNVGSGVIQGADNAIEGERKKARPSPTQRPK